MVHPPVLPPGDAYVPDEGVEDLQDFVKKILFTDFKMNVYLKYLQDHVAPQPTPWTYSRSHFAMS
ncbi:hypothetical protein KIN20_000633 [Parelaphostrongylus tenuis]|uniref:Uncharacterized protein n=1 Tax=Parelaphostrongylus tenuis TaxID=148309 RepID=A0AAD5LV25_PARTN|nr:hypothetical protein KIN20_000633 [Parelaphostrongylus tenuis]